MAKTPQPPKPTPVSPQPVPPQPDGSSATNNAQPAKVKRKPRAAPGESATAEPAAPRATPPAKSGRPSALIDTRVIYCGDNLEQLAKLPDACIDLVYIDPPFNSNRNYEVFWGESEEKRSVDDRHANTQAYIDYMRPHCRQFARVVRKAGSFHHHCNWHASTGQHASSKQKEASTCHRI